MHVWRLSDVSAHITIDCLYCESRLHICMYVSGHILIHQILSFRLSGVYSLSPIIISRLSEYG